MRQERRRIKRLVREAKIQLDLGLNAESAIVAQRILEGEEWRSMSNSHVSVRLTEELITRVDALIPALSTQWIKATRSDVMRALIEYALVRFEADQKPGNEEGRKSDVRPELGTGAGEEKAR